MQSLCFIFLWFYGKISLMNDDSPENVFELPPTLDAMTLGFARNAAEDARAEVLESIRPQLEELLARSNDGSLSWADRRVAAEELLAMTTPLRIIDLLSRKLDPNQ